MDEMDGHVTSRGCVPAAVGVGNGESVMLWMIYDVRILTVRLSLFFLKVAFYIFCLALHVYIANQHILKV